MELSARDKRILADIECAAALDDPKWTRRFERLGSHPGAGSRPGRPGLLRRRRALTVLAVALWSALAVTGATVLHPLFWAALTFAVVLAALSTAHRRTIYGYWFPRRRRRIARIPWQGGHGPA